MSQAAAAAANALQALGLDSALHAPRSGDSGPRLFEPGGAVRGANSSTVDAGVHGGSGMLIRLPNRRGLDGARSGRQDRHSRKSSRSDGLWHGQAASNVLQGPNAYLRARDPAGSEARVPQWPRFAAEVAASGRVRDHCGGRESHSWKKRGPSAVDSTPPGAVLKYPDPGQQGNDLSRSRGDWIRSGAGHFPSGFPSPPTTCLNFFALEGFICLARLVRLLWPPAFGFGRSLLTAGTPSPSPFDETNCPLDYDSPLCVGRGSPGGMGVAPQLWTAHPRGPSQNIPIRASKGMTCPDLGEIRDFWQFFYRHLLWVLCGDAMATRYSSSQMHCDFRPLN